MFGRCEDPSQIDGGVWLLCYLTTPTHQSFYLAFGTVLLLLAITAPLSLLFGFGGALASRSAIAPLRWFGRSYIAMVRGVPEIVFFMFGPIALDQAFEYLRHRMMCPDWSEPVRRGNDFVVCTAAKLPLNADPQWMHEIYGFALAILSFAIVYGAFCGNTIRGAFDAVPKAQIETARAYGMSQRQLFWRILLPQMWVFARPGLSNIWMILTKATPLLFLLGVEDIDYWARELGSAKTRAYSFPHPNWQLWYFLALLVFYLGLTRVSEIVLDRLNRRLSHGQATLGGTGRTATGR
ncbi:MAG: ABC transporter permease subunit [Pseudomonadota bacterium]|nr:ABC transporter permease subunit [Pseudomonadota bacterium]